MGSRSSDQQRSHPSPLTHHGLGSRTCSLAARCSNMKRISLCLRVSCGRLGGWRREYSMFAIDSACRQRNHARGSIHGSFAASRGSFARSTPGKT